MTPTREPKGRRIYAGALVATEAYPPGCYEPADAPWCDHDCAAVITVVDAVKFHALPSSGVPWRVAKSLDAWPVTFGGLLADIDGALCYRSMLAAAEQVHGPLLWARTREPFDFGAGVVEHCVIGWRGWDRVALLAPPAGRETHSNQRPFSMRDAYRLLTRRERALLARDS